MSFASGIVGLAQSFSFVQVYGRAIGGVMMMLFAATVFEIAALRHARLLRARENPRFRRGRVGLLLPLLAGAALWLPTTKTSILVISGVCVVFWAWRRSFESDLVDLEAERRAREVAARAEAREADRLARHAPGARRGEPVLGTCIDPHVAAARQRAIRRVRIVVERVTAIASLSTAVAFSAVAFSTITIAVAATSNSWRQPLMHRHGQRARSSHSPGPGAASGAGTQISTGKTAGGVQTAPCPALPSSSEVPAGVASELELLYTRPGRPDSNEAAQGREVTGCPRVVTVSETSDGDVYWARGEEAGQVKSIGIVSPRYKNTIVIGAAVPPTERLLQAHEDVHGPEMFPRYHAAGGVYYVLYLGALETPTLLIREHVGVESVTDPLPAVPPAAVVAWISTVREVGTWLWPIATDADTFALRTTGASQPLETVRFDPESETASRADVEGSYEATNEALSLAQIERWAPPAGP